MDDIIRIKEVDGKLITTSLNIAHVFGKEHKNVLRTIDGLNLSNDFRQLNFELTDYIDKNGDSQRKYKMTRDGWTMLVMGFQGEKAMRFKEVYISIFNKMEAELKRQITENMIPSLPANFADSLRQLATQVEENQLLKTQIKEEEHLVDFASHIQESNDSILVGDFAKIISKNGYIIGPNTLFKKLREMKLIFYRGKGKNKKNVPYQSSIVAGWFKFDEKEREVTRKDTGEKVIKIFTRLTITGKGQVYVWKRLGEAGEANDKARIDFFDRYKGNNNDS